jgi:hypothetical protein
VPADAFYLTLGRPWRSALLHSTLMQLTALAVTAGLDAACRRRFVQRYQGATACAAGALRTPPATMARLQQ